jgi:hypothetical protein
MISKMKRGVTALAVTAALLGGGLVAAAPAEAYTWTQKWYNPQTNKYWAYKNCTREEWFNGCNNGWYQSSLHWIFWG